MAHGRQVGERGGSAPGTTTTTKMVMTRDGDDARDSGRDVRITPYTTHSTPCIPTHIAHRYFFSLFFFRLWGTGVSQGSDDDAETRDDTR